MIDPHLREGNGMARLLVSTPPASWAKPYARLQTEVGLVPATPDDAIATLAPFLVPVLAGERGLAWDPSVAAWHTVDRPSG